MSDLNKFKVAVIPTEGTDNDINQTSTVDEIMNCKDLIIYDLPDYFQAQNDNELPIHFSFLINVEKKCIEI